MQRGMASAIELECALSNRNQQHGMAITSEQLIAAETDFMERKTKMKQKGTSKRRQTTTTSTPPLSFGQPALLVGRLETCCLQASSLSTRRPLRTASHSASRALAAALLPSPSPRAITNIRPPTSSDYPQGLDDSNARIMIPYC